ncbi:hypothetical protein EZV62_025000 [Acer yangbiense]|uniref:Protein kinase domain-containing protein n=1 Tax=Acer yangbiense TaxID=1000413 RepID=A0A5C7GXB8_9ROSI|nr:hypothetical protein EZV62_025000 [Acer yangbiense]
MNEAKPSASPRLLDVVKDVEFNLTTYTMIFDNVDTTTKHLYQILHGLSYLHSLGIILQDLQPAYLLINSMRQIVKIANLVLVKKYDVSACDNFDKFIYTKYSAPELILQLKNYSNAVDMWSVGCIFAEMVLKKPLFSGEIDVVIDIFRSFGGSNEDNWPRLTLSPVDTCFWGMLKDIDWLLAVKVTGLEEDGLDLLSASLDFVLDDILVVLSCGFYA